MTVATVSIASTGDAGAKGDTWETSTSPLTFGSGLRLGIRIVGVTVPQGATINTATLSTSLSSVSGTSWGLLSGVDEDTALAWSNPSVLPNNVTATTASLEFVNAATQNVVTIVQEIVDRPGWASGNAMAFITSSGGDGSINIAITASSTPTLTINYTGAGGGNFMAFFF